jgi:hypothetical protein
MWREWENKKCVQDFGWKDWIYLAHDRELNKVMNVLIQ